MIEPLGLASKLNRRNPEKYYHITPLDHTRILSHRCDNVFSRISIRCKVAVAPSNIIFGVVRGNGIIEYVSYKNSKVLVVQKTNWIGNKKWYIEPSPLKKGDRFTEETIRELSSIVKFSGRKFKL